MWHSGDSNNKLKTSSSCKASVIHLLGVSSLGDAGAVIRGGACGVLRAGAAGLPQCLAVSQGPGHPAWQRSKYNCKIISVLGEIQLGKS